MPILQPRHARAKAFLLLGVGKCPSPYLGSQHMLSHHYGSSSPGTSLDHREPEVIEPRVKNQIPAPRFRHSTESPTPTRTLRALRSRRCLGFSLPRVRSPVSVAGLLAVPLRERGEAKAWPGGGAETWEVVLAFGIQRAHILLILRHWDLATSAGSQDPTQPGALTTQLAAPGPGGGRCGPGEQGPVWDQGPARLG